MTNNRKRENATMHFDHPDGFNPNAPFYRACCCHTKTFSIIAGIFEIFIICFLLVAVLPDITTRVCDKMTNYTDFSDAIENFELENVRNMTYMSLVLCNNNITCLIWALTQTSSIVLMFYGIKSTRWLFFLPHLLFRFICMALIALTEAWVVYRAAADDEDSAAYFTSILGFAVSEIVTLYSTWVEIRGAHFVKRSRETGFSITIARNVPQATISLSDNQPAPAPQETTTRRLPPIRQRNTNHYVIQEPEPQALGNPNEIGQLSKKIFNEINNNTGYITNSHMEELIDSFRKLILPVMSQEIFYQELTEPTVGGKIRQLIALIADVPLKNVGLYYSWKTDKDVDEERLEYFNIMMAEALTSYFNVPTDANDIAKLQYFWEVVNRITCANNF